MIEINKIYDTNINNVATNKSILIKFHYNDRVHYRWIDCGDQYPVIRSLVKTRKDKANLIIAKELISKIITDNIKHNEKVLGQI